MTTKLAYERVHTGDFAGDQAQRLAQKAARALNACPLVDGRLVRGIALPAASGIVVTHGLGRPVTGYVITRSTGAHYPDLIEGNAAPDPNSQITFYSAVAAIADIWFF